MKWLQALKIYYSAPLDKTFRQFRNGAIYFAVGLIMIYLANTSLPPSAQQELIILVGLIMGAIGFVIAMLAQVRLIIGRIVQFWNKK